MGLAKQVGQRYQDTASSVALVPQQPQEDRSSFVDAFQGLLNQARKAEQRVRSLTATRTLKQQQWANYQEKMKKSWMAEQQRFNKAMEKVSTDLEAALAAQEAARDQLVCWTDKSRAAPVAPPQNDSEWESMVGDWQQEQMEAEDARSVLQRAWAGRATDRTIPPQMPQQAGVTGRPQQGYATISPVRGPGNLPADPFAQSSPPPNKPVDKCLLGEIPVGFEV
ncbi:hypothetical protein AK812_SmicGene29223 [Symbiodinium microadriaticum]|uniref:Uncharacterized protein n=1 Tax=Symbiodinium microadriaticum TaxID=2951 RepID=A0A1Q9D2C3_SYMMI|nr:hypothetical protein AK812_SmicGene29223 [Symbiodinium microadriaticum]